MSYDRYNRYGRNRYDNDDSWWVVVIGISFGALIGVLAGLAM